MLFHTWIFLLFFILFYGIFLALKKTRFREPWLLVASYVFYGWWNPLYLLLIVWSTDRKSTRLNSSHVSISYAVFC